MSVAEKEKMKSLEELLTVEEFSSWLAGKNWPHDMKYDYESTDSCLLAQYLHDWGIDAFELGNVRVYRGRGDVDGAKIPSSLQHILKGTVRERGWTIGAALMRAQDVTDYEATKGKADV